MLKQRPSSPKYVVDAADVDERAIHMARNRFRIVHTDGKCTVLSRCMNLFPETIVSDHLRPLLITCTKTVEEAQDLWLETNAVRINESSLEFTKTFKVFENFSDYRLQLLRKVLIVVEPLGKGQWCDPLPFIHFVESLPDTVQVELVLMACETCAIWCAAYRLAKLTRAAPMSWEDVDSCVRQMRAALYFTDWFPRPGAILRDQRRQCFWLRMRGMFRQTSYCANCIWTMAAVLCALRVSWVWTIALMLCITVVVLVWTKFRVTL